MKRASAIILLLAVLSFSSIIFVSQKIKAATNDNVSSEMVRRNDEVKNDQANLMKTSNSIFFNNLYSGLFAVAGTPDDSDPTSRTDAGAIGAIGGMIAFTYDKPASGEMYVADLLQNLNIIVPPVYAQGIGFSALQPILELWKIFRNISYVFFVFIFLFIGFAIMFRQNLGGQTAVTVQQALPRIIVALLAVSFSYAIAGLMIDLMWLVMYFLITIFRSANLLPTGFVENYSILNMNIFDVFTNIIRDGIATSSGEVVGNFVNNMIGSDSGITNVLGNIAGGITNVLATLVIFVAILYAMFKTFFALIKVYFEIILTIIFAPIILMMGAINGNAFGNWLKGLVANLAVFPVLLVFIIVGFMLINVGNNSVSQNIEQSGFIAPFVPGRGSAQTIGLIGGIAAIMTLSEVVAFCQKFKPSSIFDELGAKAWDNALKGRAIGVPAGAAVVGAGAGTLAGSAVGLYRGGRALAQGQGFDVARQRFTQSAGLGALAGTLGGPAVASGLPVSLAKGAFRSLREQASDVATEYTIDAQLREWQKQEGVKQKIAENILLQRQRTAQQNAPQSRTEQSTAPQTTPSGRRRTRNVLK